MTLEDINSASENCAGYCVDLNLEDSVHIRVYGVVITIKASTYNGYELLQTIYQLDGGFLFRIKEAGTWKDWK